MVLTIGCCWRTLISKSPCSQNSAATRRATYIAKEGKIKVSTDFGFTTWCASGLHHEANLTCSPSVALCPTPAPAFLLGRAAVAVGLQPCSDSSTTLLHWSSLVHGSSIKKHFQCVFLKDLTLGHSCGCLLWFSQLSFLHAEQEGEIYVFYPPLNCNVSYLATAQVQFRKELLKEIKQLSKQQVLL